MSSRPDRVSALLRERELDALLVTNMPNLRWLTGFTGTNGACIVGPDVRLFFTDFRYVELAAVQVQEFERERAGRDLLGDVAARLRGRVGFEDGSLSVRSYRRLSEATDGDAAVTEARRRATAAIDDQLRLGATLGAELSRFRAEMEHLVASLAVVHGEIVRISVSGDSRAQAAVARDVRELRSRVGTLADGLGDAPLE